MQRIASSAFIEDQHLERRKADAALVAKLETRGSQLFPDQLRFLTQLVDQGIDMIRILGEKASGTRSATHDWLGNTVVVSDHAGQFHRFVSGADSLANDR